ncbi:hypothetical protein GWI33_004374 [Rhynchophorus ferrugineus]|uniref:Uncharacterized protein n=1 Tax=Rhynchophorus ferrugineus TaxID=354439 RepID=A0A834MKQ9_RHYFE|nr:hypothetical protein GWI33_004374 [Rhynchophorus ferrugineus]
MCLSWAYFSHFPKQHPIRMRRQRTRAQKHSNRASLSYLRTAIIANTVPVGSKIFDNPTAILIRSRVRNTSGLSLKVTDPVIRNTAKQQARAVRSKTFLPNGWTPTFNVFTLLPTINIGRPLWD